MFNKNWKINEVKEIDKDILNEAGSKLVAQLLLQRGINTPQKIKNFLNPSKMEISSPFVFTDMEKTVERIFLAIENNEKIIVYGDFDADGVTSTTLLLKTLKKLNADVDFYIPNREKENHGLNTKALVRLLAKNKAKLIITVDCGISDVEQVKFVNGFNVDVIITDHHDAPEVLPDAFAILNPKSFNALKKDLSIEEIESLNQLAGVGVAFKLACALLEKTKNYDFVQQLLPLVALGTIADVVPILNENRAFVDAGLRYIENNLNKGITKLLEIGGYDIKNGVTSEQIAFCVAPRLNAAGRLDTVDNAVKLLLSENDVDISFCAQELNNLNTIRQNLCDEIFNEALEMIAKENPSESIILYKEDWHIGIIGIVASKLVEKFYKPVFLMTKDENTGFIRSSARCIPEIHLRNVIAENSELLEYFGGHSQAAGLVFNPKKITFEVVKKALNETIKTQLNGQLLKPSVFVDMELDSEDLTLDLLKEIKRLEPFGEGNKVPLFVLKNLVLKNYRTMGANNNHLKISCQDLNNKMFECVFWNKSELPIDLEKTIDIAFYPKSNTFNGITSLQLDLQDIKSEFFKTVQNKEMDFKIYDHRKKTNIYKQISDYLDNTKVSTEIYATDKNICELLNPYKSIFEKIRKRKDFSNCSQIMFFDYPASSAIMSEILKKTQAKVFHFMNYKNRKIDPQELIKNISGMLKYADKSKNGEIRLNDVSEYLSVTDDVVELCFDMFYSLGMIEILSQQSENYKIKFLKSIEFSKIKENEMYEELQQELNNIFEYRETLCNQELESSLLI